MPMELTDRELIQLQGLTKYYELKSSKNCPNKHHVIVLGNISNLNGHNSISTLTFREAVMEIVSLSNHITKTFDVFGDLSRQTSERNVEDIKSMIRRLDQFRLDFQLFFVDFARHHY